MLSSSKTKIILIIGCCIFFLALLWKTSYFESSKNIVIRSSIGTYLKNEHFPIQSTDDIIAVGNGLFYSNGQVFGWPKNSGVHQFSINNRDISAIIDPMLTEVKDYSDIGKIAIRWDSPEENNIVHIDKNGSTTYLTSTKEITRWNIEASKDLKYLCWIEFSKNDPGDKIVLFDRDSAKKTIIENKNSIHRKPLCNSSYLYWLRETIGPKDTRTISIIRISVDNKNKEEIIATSSFPNTITDYQVSSDGTVAIIKKDYDQQRSEISIYKNNRHKSLYFEDDSYMQNVVAIDDNGRFAFEIKRHRGLWRVIIYDGDKGKVDDVHKEAMSVLILRGEHNEPIIKFQPIPMPFRDIYLELLTRYSPPISGFSFYDNGFATLSITEAPAIRSLINFSEGTGDQTYLYWAAERAKNILHRTDSELFKNRNLGANNPSWSVKVFSHNPPEPASFLVHDAAILDALLLLAEKMDSNPALNMRYPGMIESIKYLFVQNYAFHKKNIILPHTDRFGLIRKDELYFTFPGGDGYKYDGINLPFNMMNSYVRPLIKYSELSGDSSYKDVAISLGKLFKRHISKIEQFNSYLWPYWWGLYSTGWEKNTISVNTPSHKPSVQNDIVDIDHASLDLRAVIALVDQKLVFDSCDLHRFANTMISLVSDGDYKTPLLIDGSIKSANYNSIEYLWGELAEHDKRAMIKLEERVQNFPYVQDAYSPTARFELIGISHLVKAAATSQPQEISVRSNCN